MSSELPLSYTGTEVKKNIVKVEVMCEYGAVPPLALRHQCK